MRSRTRKFLIEELQNIASIVSISYASLWSRIHIEKGKRLQEGSRGTKESRPYEKTRGKMMNLIVLVNNCRATKIINLALTRLQRKDETPRLVFGGIVEARNY